MKSSRRCHPCVRLLRRGRPRSATDDLAAMVGTVEREQSGLEADEGDRYAWRAPRGPDAAGIRVQSARDVEREHRAVLAVRVLDEARVIAVDVAGEADAEETVDDERPSSRRASPPAAWPTRDAKNCSCSRSAAIRASPPLLPGPASTRTSFCLSDARRAASSAAAAPARSMSGGNVSPASRSMRRIPPLGRSD